MATVEWEEPTLPEDPGIPGVVLRFAGAAAALLVAVPEAVLGSWLARSDVLWVGVPVVLGLGLALGTLLFRDRGAAIATMALGAVIGGAFVLALWMSADHGAMATTTAVGIVELTVIGIVLFGLPTLVLTIPSAIAWAAIGRRFARHLWPRANRSTRDARLPVRS